jgi:hypothetical protein
MLKIRNTALVLLCGLAMAFFLFSPELEFAAINFCEAHYWSCHRFGAVAANIEQPLILFDRREGDSRKDLERDLKIVRIRRGLDV